MGLFSNVIVCTKSRYEYYFSLFVPAFITVAERIDGFLLSYSILYSSFKILTIRFVKSSCLSSFKSTLWLVYKLPFLQSKIKENIGGKITPHLNCNIQFECMNRLQYMCCISKRQMDNYNCHF